MSQAFLPARRGLLPLVVRLAITTMATLLALATVVAAPAHATEDAESGLADCKVYDFTYDDGHTDSGTYCGSGMDVTEGLHVTALHVSCSDDFPDGVSNGASDLDGHTVSDWSIVRYDKDGTVKKTCGSSAPDEDTNGDGETPCLEDDLTAKELASALWAAGSTVDGNVATVVLPEGLCTAEINFSSYENPDDTLQPYDDQVLFDNATATVTPDNSPLELEVALPSCNWQTDLYTGSLIDTPPHHGPGRDGILIDWDSNLDLGGCVDDVASCDEGEVLNEDGVCVDDVASCDEGEVLNDEGVCVADQVESCDEGEVLNDEGVCVADVNTCDEGEVLNEDGECVDEDVNSGGDVCADEDTSNDTEACDDTDDTDDTDGTGTDGKLNVGSDTDAVDTDTDSDDDTLVLGVVLDRPADGAADDGASGDDLNVVDVAGGEIANAGADTPTMVLFALGLLLLGLVLLRRQPANART